MSESSATGVVSSEQSLHTPSVSFSSHLYGSFNYTDLHRKKQLDELTATSAELSTDKQTLRRDFEALIISHNTLAAEHDALAAELKKVTDKYEDLMDVHQRLVGRYERLMAHCLQSHAPMLPVLNGMAVGPVAGPSIADSPAPSAALATYAGTASFGNPSLFHMPDRLEELDNSDEAHVLQPINYDASREDLIEANSFPSALKSNQLAFAKLLAENRQLRKENSNFKAILSKKRGNRAQDEDHFGYKGQIVGLAKRVLFTRALFLNREAFRKERPEPPENPRDQFTSDGAYTKSLSIALFESIPETFHPLLEAARYQGFANDFIREHSEGRSTLLNIMRKALPGVLNGYNIDSDILTTATADRSKDPILASLLKFPTDKKPSRFPPVLFPGPTQNMGEVFTSVIFMKMHRLMYFGPASLVPNSKPAPNSNGIKLGLNGVTSSSMSTVAVCIRFILSPDKEFASKGAVSGINWEAEYRAYLELLEYNRNQPHIKKLFKKVHDFVFGNVTLSINPHPGESDDEADEITDLMRRFELGPDTVDSDEDDHQSVADDVIAQPASADDVPSAGQRSQSPEAPPVMVEQSGSATGRGAKGRKRGTGRGKGKGTNPVVDGGAGTVAVATRRTQRTRA
ncbi:hypothetical protein C8R43DRAFT_961953 [Mycena crocata]|nr:hypothetical protein C8R43DRAFT_961953 [Mycena crocata]